MDCFRVYANRQDRLAWSIDHGTQDTEFTVAEIKLCNISGTTKTDFSVRTGDDKTPKWWIQLDNAVLAVRGGTAYFYGGNTDVL